MPTLAKAVSSALFRELADSQDQVVSRRQLRQANVTWQHVDARIRGGTWQAIGPSVIVLHGGPLSERQKLWAAVLHGGKGAALGGLTAARADGLEGFEPTAFQVITPHGNNREDLQHEQLRVKVQESRRLGAADVHPSRKPRRTRFPRSIIDGASLASSEGRCRAIIAAAVQQRLVRPAELLVVAQSRKTLARRALIIETIGDVEGGSHSLPELEYLRGLRRVGLPVPTRQRIVKRGKGRYYLDCEFDAYKVTVEINGAQHVELLTKEFDDVRRTRLAIGGRLMVDIGSNLVRHDIELAMLITADALRSHGWVPATDVANRLRELAARRGVQPLTGPPVSIQPQWSVGDHGLEHVDLRRAARRAEGRDHSGNRR